MTKLGLALVAVIAAIGMVAPSVYAAQYCVVRNMTGQTGITNGIPSYGWFKVGAGNCFSTVDQAERAAGTGVNTPDVAQLNPFFHPIPVARPKRPDQQVYSKALP
ncbi:MAG: hypothetical protein WBG50_01880 [Desulfomonilaceae bacterium]